MKLVMSMLAYVFLLLSSACRDASEAPTSVHETIADRFSNGVAFEAGAFRNPLGNWYGGFRYGSHSLELHTNGRFSYCLTTCIGSYLTCGTWTQYGKNILLTGDSGNANTALERPVVLNTDANIFHDTVLAYFDHREFDLRNDTLFSTDTMERHCRMAKCIPRISWNYFSETAE